MNEVLRVQLLMLIRGDQLTMHGPFKVEEVAGAAQRVRARKAVAGPLAPPRGSRAAGPSLDSAVQRVAADATRGGNRQREHHQPHPQR